MKFTLPFHYTIKYVVPPKINQDKATGAASVDLEIRELDQSLAPVVMRVGNPETSKDKHDQKGRFSKKKNGELREVRIFEGKYFVEDVTLNTLKEQLADPLKLNESPFGILTPIHIVPKGTIDPTTYKPSEKDALAVPTTIEEIEAKHRKLTNKGWVSLRESKTEDDKGRALAQRLKRLAGDMIAVDGRLFVRCREPVLRIEFGNVRIDASPAKDPTFVTDDPNYPRFGDTSYSSSDAWSSLKASEGLFQFAKDHLKDAMRKTLPEFEVVDPYWSRFDGVAHDISTMVNSLQDTLRGNMTKLPRPLLEAYYILRDSNQEDKYETMAVSPAILYAVDLIATYSPPPIEDGLSAAAFERQRFEREKDEYSYGHLNANFTVDIVDKRKDILGFVLKAAKIKARWDSRSLIDQFETKAGWDMRDTFNGLTLREANSEAPVFAASTRLDVDPKPILRAARTGSRVIVLSDEEDRRHAIAIIRPDGTIKLEGARGDETKLRSAVSYYLQNEKDYTQEAGLSASLAMARGA